MPEVYGPLIDATQVEQAVIDTLKLWAPAYLEWVCRERGLPAGTLPAPVDDAWQAVNDLRTGAFDTLIPRVAVVSTGLADSPTRTGGGGYDARWVVAIGVVDQGVDLADTRRRVRLRTAALRTLLLERPLEGGIDQGVEWLDEDYAQGDPTRDRTLGVGYLVFQVDTRYVADEYAGLPPAADPPADPTDPVPDYETATSTSLELEAIPIDE